MQYKSLIIATLLCTSPLLAGEQFAMSDSDRALYAELLENNPAEMDIEWGSELLEEHCGGDAGIAAYLGIKERDLPKYIAGFPRYIKKNNAVLGIDQVLQIIMSKHGDKPFKLKSKEMFAMLAYVKSLANDEAVAINIHENAKMKEAYTLGKEVFMTPRGGRGLSCNSCHSADIVGSVLRTQPLPDLGKVGAGATWPAYRMTKSSLRTLQRRFQGCMKNALLKVLPIGSKEMVALEVYVTNLAKENSKTIQIPGLKR